MDNVNYNSIDDIIFRLLYGQFTDKKPHSSKLPLPYTLIPGEIRLLIQKILFKSYAKKYTDSKSFPSSYLDNSVDIWLINNYSKEENQNKWSWPRGKKCALVLSHDTDTPNQEKGITLLVDVATKRKIKNTISFVGKDLKYYAPFINDLSERGVEIALHDSIHDNTIAFLEKDKVKLRLQHILNEYKNRNGIVGFRSPSWYVSKELWDALDELDFLYDMSALDTWSLFSKSANYGVCTFFPFIKNNLVIIPNTIPFELPWVLGYTVDKTFDFWKHKFDTIANHGGLIMFNAHPDRWFCGNEKAIIQLEKSLDYVIAKYDPEIMTAQELALHTKKERVEQRMICIDTKENIFIPKHSR